MRMRSLLKPAKAVSPHSYTPSAFSSPMSESVTVMRSLSAVKGSEGEMMKSRLRFRAGAKPQGALAHPCLETDKSCLMRQQLSADFPAQDHRPRLVLLHGKDRVTIRLRTAGDVLQPSGQAVADGHVVNRLA